MSTRDQTIEEVMAFCSISNTDATKLLGHFDWNAEDAINTFLTDPSIVTSINNQEAVSDISLSDSITTPDEPSVASEDIPTNEIDEEEIYEEEDEPPISELKNWSSTKLEQMFCPPKDFLTTLSLFAFLKQIQDIYKEANKHLFSRQESPKRSKSDSSFYVPVVFVKDNEDFLSQSVYRDILKHQSISKKLTKHFRCIEIEYKDQITKLFSKKYNVKYDMCLIFLHPLTWELIEVVYRVDLKNRDVIKGVIENIIKRIFNMDTVNNKNESDKEIEIEENGDSEHINTNYENNGNIIEEIHEEDLVKFKIYSEFGPPTFIKTSKHETVKDLVNRTFIYFKKDEKVENYKIKRRGPGTEYIGNEILLSDILKHKDLILVNVNK